MNKSSTLLASLVGMGMMDGFPLPPPKVPKVKRLTLLELISEEESTKLSNLELDRTSPGRKALKDFKKELSQKYRS